MQTKMEAYGEGGPRLQGKLWKGEAIPVTNWQDVAATASATTSATEAATATRLTFCWRHSLQALFTPGWRFFPVSPWWRSSSMMLLGLLSPGPPAALCRLFTPLLNGPLRTSTGLVGVVATPPAPAAVWPSISGLGGFEGS